jgi:hypothetical protein
LEHSRFNWNIDFVIANYHITPNLVLFVLLMKKLRMANLIICLRNSPLLQWMSIYHLLLRAVVSYGSWIYNYLCNQCLAFHHLSCEFEFLFSPDTPVSATNKTVSSFTNCILHVEDYVRSCLTSTDYRRAGWRLRQSWYNSTDHQRTGWTVCQISLIKNLQPSICWKLCCGLFYFY